jgi:hypothetical protein
VDTGFFQHSSHPSRQQSRQAPAAGPERMPADATGLPKPTVGRQPRERRSQTRYAVDGIAHALVRRPHDRPVETRGKSMAEIACGVFNADPVLQGCICDISAEGLAFLSSGSSDHPQGSRLVLDILMVGAGFYLRDLAFSTVAVATVDGDKPFDPFTWKRLGVKFHCPTPTQRAALNYFIKQFCERKTGGHHEFIDVHDSGQRAIDPI